MALEQLGKNAQEGCVAPGLHNEVTVSGAAAVTLTADQSGGTFLWDGAAGIAYTLPAPVAGMKFKFVCTVTVTSNAHSVSTDGASTFLQGAVWQLTAASATGEGQTADGSSDVTCSMNGTTTGGVESTTLEFECITSTQWNVTGFIVASGTLATPFA